MAVSVTLDPAHTDGADDITVTVGGGVMLTVTVLVSVQLPDIPTTE